MVETTQTDLVNYEAEEKKLEEAQNMPDFFNPQAGKYTVHITSEMSKYEFLDKKDGTVQRRAKISILCNGLNYTWSFGIGQTKASLYGQLVEFARKNNNALSGTELTLVVKSDGKKRDFTIV